MVAADSTGGQWRDRPRHGARARAGRSQAGHCRAQRREERGRRGSAGRAGRRRDWSRGGRTAEADCQGLVERTLAHFGRVDVLVNNAGINIRKQPQDYTLAEWHAIIDGNLTSAFLCARAVYPALLKAGGGKIINNASLSAILGLPFAAPYGASKGGIVQLTRSLATAWAKDNIQVNAVLPGWVDTDLARQARIDVPGLHDRVISRTPTQRWGAPEDFAGIAVFLASSASDYVTGAAIPVDGGYAIQP